MDTIPAFWVELGLTLAVCLLLTLGIAVTFFALIASKPPVLETK